MIRKCAEMYVELWAALATVRIAGGWMLPTWRRVAQEPGG
jgi:hypothetical protein